MENFIILILGRKGSGKTYFVIQGIPLIRESNSIIIFDTLNEYDDFINIYSPDDLVDFLNKEHNENFIVSLKDLDDEKANQYFRIINTLENITVICEEIDYYFGAMSFDKDLLKLIKYGRHKNINIIGITRRPFETNIYIRSQADLVISFQQLEPRDLEWIAKRMGKEKAEKLKKLPLYKFIANGDYTLLKKYWNVDYKESSGDRIQDIDKKQIQDKNNKNEK